jgi:hypothetical protein
MNDVGTIFGHGYQTAESAKNMSNDFTIRVTISSDGEEGS